MNIAVCCPRSLDFQTGNQQTYRVESKILTMLSERGHRVTMYTAVNGSYSPNENVRLMVGKPLRDDEDVLFVVNGAWGEKFINRESARAYNLISEWHGPIIYSQNDPKLPLAYNPERIRDNVVEDLDCEVEDIFTGVDKVIVLTNSVNVEHAREHITDKHNPYDETAPFEIDVRFHDLCAYVVDDLPTLDPNGHLFPELAQQGVYVGNYRPRTKSFRRLFEPMGDEWHCYGKGWDKNADRFKGCKDQGFIRHHEVAETYSKYEYTFTVFDDAQQGSSAITLRLFESVLGGCLTFVDALIWQDLNHCPLYGEGLDPLIVETAEEARTLIEECRSTKGLREAVIREQQQIMLDHANCDLLLEELESIMEEVRC